MAEIPFECPACGQHLQAEEAGADLSVRCPACGIPVPVPGRALPTDSAANDLATRSGDPLAAPPAAPDTRPDTEASPFTWIQRGIVDSLRGAPVLFVVLLGAGLLNLAAASCFCVGDLLVFGPLLCGVWAVALGLVRRQPGTLERCLDGFKVYWRAVVLGLLWLVMGGLIGLLFWGLFLLFAFLLPVSWLISGVVCALLAGYFGYRFCFAIPLLVDRQQPLGESLAGSWRMTSGLQMQLAWVVLVLYGVFLGAIIALMLTLVAILLGVGLVESVRSSKDFTKVFTGLGNMMFVLGPLALLMGGGWMSMILMPLAHGYNHLVSRLAK
jgi:hypothetical protein